MPSYVPYGEEPRSPYNKACVCGYEHVRMHVCASVRRQHNLHLRSPNRRASCSEREHVGPGHTNPLSSRIHLYSKSAVKKKISRDHLLLSRVGLYLFFSSQTDIHSTRAFLILATAFPRSGKGECTYTKNGYHTTRVVGAVVL